MMMMMMMAMTMIMMMMLTTDLVQSPTVPPRVVLHRVVLHGGGPADPRADELPSVRARHFPVCGALCAPAAVVLDQARLPHDLVPGVLHRHPPLRGVGQQVSFHEQT
jgi:hypothetical protein